MSRGRRGGARRGTSRPGGAVAVQASLALETPRLLDEGERWAESRGYRAVVGVDEVGRGPLAGPVVAAAAWLPAGLRAKLIEEGLDDSKRLSPERREQLALLIRAGALTAVGSVDARGIDEMNILRASFQAMGRAVLSLRERMLGEGIEPDLLLVDGAARMDPHPLPGVRQHALVKGDGRSVSIAAASVVAKVQRDSLMRSYDEQYPGYGFSSHKGYLSREHQEALRRLGPSPIHRMSFRGVSPNERDGQEEPL